MSSTPVITFKAGTCDFDTSSNPPTVKPKPTLGYLYLFEEDELVHFCWCPRSASMMQPELDLTMVPTDGSFTPYEFSRSDSSKSVTNGRIFVLRFQSSTQRHFFWLQSKSQHAQGEPAWFSPRDLKLGQIVDRLLQGAEVNVEEEISTIMHGHSGDGDDDDDSTSRMEDVRSEGQSGPPGNIASGDPFIGDPGEEGQNSREGGADGGRAAVLAPGDASVAVQNFLNSMQGNQAFKKQSLPVPVSQFATLLDLLPTSTTIRLIDKADEAYINILLSHIPPVLFFLSQEIEEPSFTDSTTEIKAAAALASLSINQKKEILRKVLRSPQFSQSLVGLTFALRDGGLPSISDALGIPIENGGFISNSRIPVGGGDAVKAFVDGVKADVEKKDTAKQNERDTS